MTRISEFILNFLLNATWQIVAITMVASVGARLLKHAPARYRYTLWIASLLFSVGLPFWSVFGIQPKEVVTGTPAPGFSNSHPGSQSAKTTNPVTTDPEEGNLSVSNLLVRRSREVETAPILLFALTIAYALFLLYRLTCLARWWRQKERLRQSAYELELPPKVKQIANLCRSVFGLRKVRLVSSTTALLPVTVGAHNPLIVLPERLYSETREETLLSVIGHEMAHVSRRDFGLNLICELVRLPISFHPCTSLIKRQIERARELACDELVTERLLPPEAYARSLVRLANTSVRPTRQAFVVSIFDADILEERIMKLTQKRQRLSLRFGRTIFITTLTVLCFAALTMSSFSFDLRSRAAAPKLQAVVIPAAATLSGALPVEIERTRQLTPERTPEQTPEQTNAAQSRKPLDSDSAQDRAQAACDAGRNNAVEAIPMLISMLGDDTNIEPVKCWNGGRWSPALETFKQASPGEQAAIALASMGKPAFEPLVDQLDNANASVRRNAAWAIGELTNFSPAKRSSAVPRLVSMLSDSDQWVRMAAARALGELRDERAGETLIATLSDSQWRVRELAAWALSEMKDERAVQALCQTLLTDSQAEVRRSAAEALGEIRSSEAISSLKQALNDPEPRVRAKAGWAIAEIDDSDG
jgi:beta-lactamase regulating signal transducer with metallopeptidase domain